MCSGLWEEKESWDSPPHMSGNKTNVRNSGWLRKGHFLQDLAGGKLAFLVVVVDAGYVDASQEEKCSFQRRYQDSLFLDRANRKSIATRIKFFRPDVAGYGLGSKIQTIRSLDRKSVV